MNRTEIEKKILEILHDEFEIETPDFDENLAEKYEFDSIDAIDMLVLIEQYLKSSLTVEEKRKAVNIRTIRHICDYVEEVAKARNLLK